MTKIEPKFSPSSVLERECAREREV